MEGTHRESYDPSGISKPRAVGYLSAGPRVSTHPNAEMGGPRAHVLGVIQGFRSLGWQVFPYIVGDRVPLKIMKESAQKLERSVLVRLAADIARLIMGIWHCYRAWRELNGKVDWVYERFAALQCLGWIFQKHGVPWILETNAIIFREAVSERKSIALSGAARVLELWAYRQCDVLICVSEVLKELVIDEAGIPAQKVLVVPNGVDIVRFDPSKYDPNRSDGRPTIGFIGSLFHWHRLDVLLAAIADLRIEGIALDLVVVGDGPTRETWKSQATELGLQEHVRFLGQVPWNEIPLYISTFDLAYMGHSPLDVGKIYFSPIKLYEYMAMARTVVASECADTRQMITSGLNGYLFKPADKDDLKRALREALQEKHRWHKIGLAARARVIEKASWPSRVREMIIGIEQILEGQSAHPFA